MIVNETDLQTLTRKHKLFREIHTRLGEPPSWFRPPGFASLSKIILEQQVSLASANAHFQKLLSFVRDFSPENILALSNEEMRACQVSRQKTVYLRALAEVMKKSPDFLNQLAGKTAAETRGHLTSIKGIGHWTTDVYLMFCLQAKDIFPIGDIAVVNTIRELTPAKSKEEMLSLAETWQPLRSLATYFLWHHYLRKRNRHIPAEGYAALLPDQVKPG